MRQRERQSDPQAEEVSLSITELAGATGGEVTPRTIRYYIAEGLLPRPDERGRYSPAHRDRLRLIQRYKEAFLPLEKVREQITALSNDEVRAFLEQSDAEEVVAAAEAPAPRLEEALAPAPLQRQSAAAEYTARLLAARKQAPKKTPESGRQPNAAASPQPEAWERITLLPGVLEMHVRADIAPGLRERINRILETVRKMLP